jgi:hypothetical protein
MSVRVVYMADSSALFGALLCVLVLVVVVYWIWRPIPPIPPRQCTGPGTCDYDSDCGKGGKCQKINGVCTCTLWVDGLKVVTNNCYRLNRHDPKLPDACSKEYGYFNGQTGPNGEKGSAEYPGGECPGGPPYTACAACPLRDYGPVPCVVSGWVPAGGPLPGCAMASGTRPASSYKCIARP